MTGNALAFVKIDDIPVASATLVRACALDRRHAFAVVDQRSPDGKTFAPAAFVWSTVTGAWKQSTQQPPPRVEAILAMVGLGDGRAVAFATLRDAQRAVDREVVLPLTYDVATGKWTEGLTCDVGRSFFELAVLPDGSVQLSGGASKRPSARVDRFDPKTGVWRRMADMPSARIEHRAISLLDGRVLIMGGRGSDDAAHNTTFVYEPDVDRWIPAGVLAESREGHVATRLGDGRVAVFGGQAEGRGRRSVEVFDPAIMAWTWGKVLNEYRTGPAATLLADGRVLVSGGLRSNRADETSESMRSSEIWSPATFVSNDGPPLCVARHAHDVFAMSGGRYLVVGGGFGSTQRKCELLGPSGP